MKTFKNYLSESENKVENVKQKATLNWLYADIIETTLRSPYGSNDDIDKEDFKKYRNEHKSDETLYFDYLHSTDAIYRKFYDIYCMYIDKYKISSNGDITCMTPMEIDEYNQLRNVKWDGRIIKCTEINFSNHEFTRLMIDPWWPKICEKIRISEKDGVKVYFSGIHNVVKECKSIIFMGGDITIEGGVLGLLLVDKLLKVDFNTGSDINWIIEQIINKNLGSGRQGVLAAQAELIEAGLEEHAKL